MFIIVLGQHVSILIESSSGPSKKIDPRIFKHFKQGSIFLAGPVDDSIRNETWRPSTIINTIKVLLCLTDT